MNTLFSPKILLIILAITLPGGVLLLLFPKQMTGLMNGVKARIQRNRSITCKTFTIPPYFLNVCYNGAHYPCSANTNGLEGGANCQQFAYELLRHFGWRIPNLRSRELWEDTVHTQRVEHLQPLDLLLWNKTADPYGAHVGVYVGDGQAIHLSRENGHPVIEPLAQLVQNPLYCVFVGAKRVIVDKGHGSLCV